MPERHKNQPDSPERNLWASVLLQVQEDILDAPLDGLVYAEAVAFVRDSGLWAESRAAIASCLDLHVDEIQRAGRRWIAARRKAEGMPAVEELVAPRPFHVITAAPAPLPTLVATPAPERTRRPTNPRHRWQYNPFKGVATADRLSADA